MHDILMTALMLLAGYFGFDLIVPHPPGPYTNYLIELGKRHAPLVR